MEDTGEIVVNATKVQIEEFKESLLWGDILRELDMWMDNIKRANTTIVYEAMDKNYTSANVLLRLGEVEGGRKAIYFVKMILENFLTVLEDKENDARHESAE